MKRHNNIFEKIIDIKNITQAERLARRGKNNQNGVIKFLKNPKQNLLYIQNLLITKKFKTAPYKTFTIYEPKQRLIYQLPYMPDRIVQHAIMIPLKHIFVSMFTTDTYSCIKGRGVHACVHKLKQALKNVTFTKYFLKIDIKKFYPSIKNHILKAMLRKKFKDLNLLALLDNIIDSAVGLPIGNYTSQYLANFYLCYFDHWVKEVCQAPFYFRYADDMVFLHHSKLFLHQLRGKITDYLNQKLELKIRVSTISPVACGIRFLGYVFRHFYTLCKKEIKQKCARMLTQNPSIQSYHSYLGWFKHANCKNLIKTLTYATT